MKPTKPYERNKKITNDKSLSIPMSSNQTKNRLLINRRRKFQAKLTNIRDRKSKKRNPKLPWQPCKIQKEYYQQNPNILKQKAITALFKNHHLNQTSPGDIHVSHKDLLDENTLNLTLQEPMNQAKHDEYVKTLQKRGKWHRLSKISELEPHLLDPEVLEELFGQRKIKKLDVFRKNFKYDFMSRNLEVKTKLQTLVSRIKREKLNQVFKERALSLSTSSKQKKVLDYPKIAMMKIKKENSLQPFSKSSGKKSTKIMKELESLLIPSVSKFRLSNQENEQEGFSLTQRMHSRNTRYTKGTSNLNRSLDNLSKKKKSLYQAQVNLDDALKEKSVGKLLGKIDTSLDFSSEYEKSSLHARLILKKEAQQKRNKLKLRKILRKTHFKKPFKHDGDKKVLDQNNITISDYSALKATDNRQQLTERTLSLAIQPELTNRLAQTEGAFPKQFHSRKLENLMVQNPPPESSMLRTQSSSFQDSVLRNAYLSRMESFYKSKKSKRGKKFLFRSKSKESTKQDKKVNLSLGIIPQLDRDSCSSLSRYNYSNPGKVPKFLSHQQKRVFDGYFTSKNFKEFEKELKLRATNQSRQPLVKCHPKRMTKKWAEEFKKKMLRAQNQSQKNLSKRLDIEITRNHSKDYKRPKGMQEQSYWICTPEKMERVKHREIVTPWTDEELERATQLPEYVKEAYKNQMVQYKKSNPRNNTHKLFKTVKFKNENQKKFQLFKSTKIIHETSPIEPIVLDKHLHKWERVRSALLQELRVRAQFRIQLTTDKNKVDYKGISLTEKLKIVPKVKIQMFVYSKIGEYEYMRVILADN